MINANIYNANAEKVETIDLPDNLFGLKVNEALIHQAVVAQMANERQVIAHTKDRSEVSGGGKKPWRQKGTGRARAGSSRSPIWIGGGVTFGPRSERNYKKKINKKMGRKALLMVLSDRLASSNLAIIDVMAAEEYKTKLVDNVLKEFEKKVFTPAKEAKSKKRSILILNENKDEKAKHSARNLDGVKYLNADNVNILDMVKYREVIATKAVIEKIIEQNNK
jgi:large subunit ribosomal protein L4